MNPWCRMVHLLRKILILLAMPVFLAGCVGSVSGVLDVANKASAPVPAKLVAEMHKKGMTVSDPILVRIFKEESELEIWKRDRTGRYALLKTYPMCRWSGQLGPKKKSGDRQAPEGFYQVNAGMLNPTSLYYLSFNLGYPNKLERALGYEGEALMVHGACSSSGCFAMTDEGVAEIYAVARDALKGGQPAFQVQAFPFRMTAQNMARNRSDPNAGFWQDLKQGYDAFEITRIPPQISYCGGRYMFNSGLDGQAIADPLAECPPSANPLTSSISSDPKQEVSTTLLSSDVRVHGYVDGGMHPSFRKLLKSRGAKELAKETSTSAVPISRPEAALADPHAQNE